MSGRRHGRRLLHGDTALNKNKPKRVVVSAASGLVGKAVVAALTRRGDVAERLVRRIANTPGEIAWDPAHGVLEASALEGADAVVHLSGEPIAEGRWTPARKACILGSRVASTRLIAERLADCARKPESLVCASAVGFYGDRGGELLEEDSAPGNGFLPDVCKAWEDACAPARAAGIRVVNLRIAVVLSADGGALAQMLTPFRLGFGGRLGPGTQYMSWITLEDLTRAFLHAIDSPALRGPVNGCAPDQVTNAAFTQALAQALHRPAILPVPAALLRLTLGEMADALLLASMRIVPRRLQQSGFEFQHPTLAEALKAVLPGRP